jgi:hypothetical protein
MSGTKHVAPASPAPVPTPPTTTDETEVTALTVPVAAGAGGVGETSPALSAVVAGGDSLAVANDSVGDVSEALHMVQLGHAREFASFILEAKGGNKESALEFMHNVVFGLQSSSNHKRAHAETHTTSESPGGTSGVVEQSEHIAKRPRSMGTIDELQPMDYVQVSVNNTAKCGRAC